jgi:hypothetical protein
MGSQLPTKNLCQFSQFRMADRKNRTGIGTHSRAGKNQQFQADYRAMSGGLKLPTNPAEASH